MNSGCQGAERRVGQRQMPDGQGFGWWGVADRRRVDPVRLEARVLHVARTLGEGIRVHPDVDAARLLPEGLHDAEADRHPSPAAGR